MSFLRKKSLLMAIAFAMIVLGLQSCGSRKYLIIPHSVSTASAVTAKDLNLKASDYSVINTITETASVFCEYKNTEIIIKSGDGDFSYKFQLNFKKGNWYLKSFSGVASLGYFSTDYKPEETEVPNGEEFARRVAMARIINAARDYGADAVIEPICVTQAFNAGINKVEYRSTVSAKLIQIKVK